MLFLTIAAALANAPSVFVVKPCTDPANAAIATCGSVEVAEDREKPNGRRISLNVIVLPAESPAPHLPPLFDIEGGPGLAVTKNARFYMGEGAAYRKRRDIVMVDQRGTGGSNPLNCPELAAPQAAMKPLYPIKAVSRCRASLERKADLTRYLTHDAVADLDAVRTALGYERIDLNGLSYGTTVALRYLATYPQRVRAAVLMGVAPPSAMPPANHATAAERAFDLLADECAAERLCSHLFDLRRDFALAVARRSKARVGLSREMFAEKLRSLMYQPATARRIPWIVHAAAMGDLKPLLKATRPVGPSPYYDGMYLSVTCAEGFALMDYHAAEAKARKTRFGDYRLRRQRAACGVWSKGAAEPNFLAPIRSPAAILLISGEIDPVTPPAWAEALAKALPNARHVLIPASGHVFDGMSGIDSCFDPMVVGFLDTGDLKTIDPACLVTMRPPPFATGSEH